MPHIILDFIDNTIPMLAPFSWEQYGLNLVFTHPFGAYCLQLAITIVSAYFFKETRLPPNISARQV
ncbi:MAG: hypothetical protein QW491_05390 [Thermoproteota archaeon]